MKETKRTPLIDLNKIKSLSEGIKIDGNILLSSFSENKSLYIISDIYFYFKEEGKILKDFMLIPAISKDDNKYQTTENKSHIWYDQYSYHTIIYHNKRAFYFNPSFSDNPKEIDIIDKSKENGKYLELYSVYFCENENKELNKTKFEIIFSDYYSNIYSLNININIGEMDIKPVLLYRFRKIYNIEEDFGFNDLDIFNLEDNEIITDIKILSNELTKEKEIIAVTKNTIFKFEGKGTYKEVFEKYSR